MGPRAKQVLTETLAACDWDRSEEIPNLDLSGEDPLELGGGISRAGSRGGS